jgi:DUF4097 and DUF4098 domain-containing protein YvlB
MRAKLVLPALAVALLGLSACDIEDFGNVGRYHSDFHYSYPLKSGGTLAVESFNGSIEISSWDQDTVDISGTKTGPTQQEADDLKVDIEHTADAISIRVPRPSYRRNNLGARFAIKAPRGLRLDRIVTSNGAIRTEDGAGPARLRTSNGQVRMNRWNGSVDVQTSNGSIELLDVEGDATVHTSNSRVRADRLAGSLQAETSNGSVIALMDRPDRPVRVSTSNGSVELTLPPGFRADIRANTSNSGITLHLPADLNARVSARTSNSSITSDFEVRMQGVFNKHNMDAIIGAGGPLIDLTTSNGGIRLLRR